MELTQKQKNKIQKIADVIDQGPIAIAEMIFAIEEKIDEEMPNVMNILNKLKGDKGDDYILTDDDKHECVTEIIKAIDLDKIAQKTAPLVKFNLNDIATKASKLITPPKDGKTPSKSELIALIKQLIPEPIPGESGADADEESIVKKIENDLPKLGDLIAGALELLKDGSKLKLDAIEGLTDALKKLQDEISSVRVTKNGNVGFGGLVNTVRMEDLSPQCDGITKVFEVPRHRRIVGLRSTQFPIIFRPGIDFTTVNKVLTLTDEVSAIELGQTLIFEYIK